MSDLAIFHYHLFPGGVTSVVGLSVRAILAHLPEVRRITLVCGSDRHLKSLQRHIAAEAPEAESRVVFDVLPEIFYLSREGSSRADRPDPGELKRLLLSRYRGALWWVHNYHLGKNPVFTQALLEIAEEAPDQRMLFHIHDFPECARFENLAFLESLVTRHLYPTYANLRYAVINGRDFALLRRSGMPESRLFLLNNPVPADRLPEVDRELVRRRLEEFFATRFPGYRTGAPQLFYPVRTIRRKNVFESGLIAAVSPEPVNLVVTLPGASEKELPYSQLVEESFGEGEIPGMWGIGSELSEAGIGFQSLAISTDCVVSSSVQEGFGYLFIDGRRWRKPVFARYLDILDGITEIIDGRSAHFYREIAVPLDAKKRAHLVETYRNRIESVAPYLPSETNEQLARETEEAFSGEVVDFSYLSVAGQREILKAAGDAEFARELVELNRDTFAALERLLASTPEEAGERIQANFSLAAFAQSLSKIIESYDSPTTDDGSESQGASDGSLGRIHERLRSGFATLEYVRLLYE